MSKPDNGRRRRPAGEGSPQVQAVTIKLPLDLVDRLDDYKNELKKQARVDGTERPTLAGIIAAAVEDYLKKKGG